MSDDVTPDTAAPDLHLLSRLEVRFVFDEGWQIISPNRVTSFPPGGGLTPPAPIEITPLDLTLLSPADAQAAIVLRAAKLAEIAEALALAQLQFAAALDAWNAQF